jgi:phosphoribosylamine---glycine ligase
MASGGYPGEFRKGHAIHGLETAAKIDDLIVFHAGTAASGSQVVNAGGRVLGVTGLGETVAAAIDKAYQGVRVISWEGAHYRTDIGKKALGR